MIVTRYLIFNFSAQYQNFNFNAWQVGPITIIPTLVVSKNIFQRGVIKPIRSRHYLAEWLKDDDSDEEKKRSGTNNNR